MFYFETIESDTLELLKKLQQDPVFMETRLVGGTALALQLGHRKSVDLDLFGKINMDGEVLAQTLRQYGEMTRVNKNKCVETYFVHGVKVDFVNYTYTWLTDSVSSEGLTLASLTDIAAMKLEAITNRGSKKDFIDFFFLLNTYTLTEMLNLYLAKYPQGSAFLVLKSLVYFDDAEDEPMPFMLQSCNWDDVKERICGIVREIA